MNEIQLYQKPNDLASLPQRVAEIQAALSSRMIKDLSEPELFEVFKSNISKCYVISRFAAPEGIELTVIIDETMKMAKARFGNLRSDEISIAFTRGIAKEYGDYMGLSFITFVEWLKAYMKEEARINLTTPVPEVKTEPTREEKFDLFVTNALQAFSGHRAGKDISLVASSVYRFLRRLDLFVYSEEEQEEFINRAQKEVIAHLHMKKSTVLDKNVRNQIERQLSAPETLEQTIILQAQRLGLYAYFQSLIIEEGDLKQLLAAKKEQILC
jgi:hypothetical protein